MKSFILASGNPHKADEFKVLFGDTIEVRPAPGTIDVHESGATYFENAYLKARAYYEAFKTPSLADDSGLTVEALPLVLGVQSARFAPELNSYSDKCLRIIEMLNSAKVDSRIAYFTCVLCFYLSSDEVFFFEGRVHGNIGFELKGLAGFGYDPIFLPERNEQDGKSLAELPEWKNEFSHRAKAVQAALDFFKESIDKTAKWP